MRSGGARGAGALLAVLAAGAACAGQADFDGRRPRSREGTDFRERTGEGGTQGQVPGGRRTWVKAAFIADQGLSRNARHVLRRVKAEGADLLLIQGDFDYEDDPEAWDKLLTSELGADFPVFASLGNHDVQAREGYARKMEERLKRVRGASCSGEPLVRWSCSYQGLSMVFTAWGLGEEAAHEDFLREELAKASGPWRICSWHIPHRLMQVGGKAEEPGWGAYEECRKAGALIATGHEHSYSRTQLMEDFSSQRLAPAQGRPLMIEKGRTIAFVSGLGGQRARRQRQGGAWWAAVHTRDQGAEAGALFCIFGKGAAERAVCYFKEADGRVPDSFELESR